MRRVKSQSTRPGTAPWAYVLLFLSAALYAQSGSIGLENLSGGTAFVISLPTNPAEYAELSSSSRTMAGLIRQYADRAVLVPDGGISSGLPLYRQDTLLFGYIRVSGELEHPIFAMLIPGSTRQNGDEDRSSYYRLRASDFLKDDNGALLRLSLLADELPHQPVKLIDGSIIDWLSDEDTLRFSRNAQPLRVRRESSGNSAVIAIGDSVFWGRGGSTLDRLRLSLDDQFLYGMFTSFTELSDGLSLLLFYYEDRDNQQENLYTLEVALDGNRGQVLLWYPDGRAQVLGNYHRGGFFTEFLVRRSQLPAEIRESLAGIREGSFDISTGFTDGNIFEEFLLGNVPIHNLTAE